MLSALVSRIIAAAWAATERHALLHFFVECLTRRTTTRARHIAHLSTVTTRRYQCNENGIMKQDLHVHLNNFL